MSDTVAGTITSIGQPSAIMPKGQGAFKLTTVGCDASNTIKTQRSDDDGYSWTDDTTYNSEQAATVITPANTSRQYRGVGVALQASRHLGYKMSRES